MLSHKFRAAGSITGASFAVAGMAALLALAVPRAAAGIEISALEAILVDYQTGEVMFEKDADAPMAPSSMSKIMTVYKVFERLKDGRLQLSDSFAVSEKAWRKKGSKMFVAVNSRVKVEDLIRGIVVQSGNDASIVVAEGLAGSEDAFAAELNETARELGMVNTNFVNASGWPDEAHRVTARDLALLAKRTIENFPQYYGYYSELEFTYNEIRQGNRNPLLYKKIGADGLKTGYIRASKFNLAASAKHRGRRLFAVVFGARSPDRRDREMANLLDGAFSEMARTRIASVTSSPTPSPASGGLPLPPPKKPVIDTVGAPWAMQVGAFSRISSAYAAVENSLKHIPGIVVRAAALIVPVAEGDGGLYRARFVGVSWREAQRACKILTAKRLDCEVVQHFFESESLALAD